MLTTKVTNYTKEWTIPRVTEPVFCWGWLVYVPYNVTYNATNGNFSNYVEGEECEVNCSLVNNMEVVEVRIASYTTMNMHFAHALRHRCLWSCR